MPTIFKEDDLGPYVEADPDSDLDYSITTWLEGLIFLSAVWTIIPDVAGSIHDQSINVGPVTIDGKPYAIGEVASAWIKGLTAGQEYKIRIRGTFTGNRIDDRTFRIKCINR